MQYLQLLRGYAIINIHMREHQVCATFYPRSRCKNILILDVTIKIKKHIPTLAPLFSLLVQHRLTPTQTFTPRAYAEMTGPCKWLTQSHFGYCMLPVEHSIVQNSLGKGIGTGFMMKMFASCFHTQRAQIRSCTFCNRLCFKRYHNKWRGLIKTHPACSWSSKPR